MHDPLTEETLLLYCMRHYDGGFLATTKDFQEDIDRIKYIKKLITRYKDTNRKDLKFRLLMNHLIILTNVFTPQHGSRIIYYHLHSDFDIIKPFLVVINCLPDKYINIHGLDNSVDTDTITMDQNVINLLRQL